MRSSTPRRAPPASSATTASTSAPTAGRSMQTTGVPPATIPARYDWSSAVGTTNSAITRRSTIADTISASRSERSRVDAERMKRSPPPMTASTPCSTPVQNGSPTPAVTTPTIDVVPRVRSRRANWLGRKPSSSTARRTRATISGRTWRSLLSARDTVFGDTPARSATSLTVGALRSGAVVTERAPIRARRPMTGRRSRRPGAPPTRRHRRRLLAPLFPAVGPARHSRAWHPAARRRLRSG